MHSCLFVGCKRHCLCAWRPSTSELMIVRRLTICPTQTTLMLVAHSIAQKSATLSRNTSSYDPDRYLSRTPPPKITLYHFYVLCYIVFLVWKIITLRTIISSEVLGRHAQRQWRLQTTRRHKCTQSYTAHCKQARSRHHAQGQWRAQARGIKDPQDKQHASRLPTPKLWVQRHQSLKYTITLNPPRNEEARKPTVTVRKQDSLARRQRNIRKIV